MAGRASTVLRGGIARSAIGHGPQHLKLRSVCDTDNAAGGNAAPIRIFVEPTLPLFI